MAVPKRKTSKARRDKRKSANMKMKAPGLSICPQCHEPKLPHRVCPNCNYYDGRNVVELRERRRIKAAARSKGGNDAFYRIP